MPFQSRVLWFLGSIFQWLSQLFLLGIFLLVPGLILALLGYLPWPFLLLFLGFPGYLIFDTISSLFGFFLLESLKTCAQIDEIGIHGRTPESSFLLEWPQIVRIRRRLARPFPPANINFRDHTSFEFTLQKGETIWVDELDSKRLHYLATNHGIELENFENISLPLVTSPPIAPPH